MTQKEVIAAKPCTTKPVPKQTRLSCTDAKLGAFKWNATLHFKPKLQRVELETDLGVDRATAEPAFKSLVAALEKTYGQAQFTAANVKLKTVAEFFDRLDEEWDNRSGEHAFVGWSFRFKRGRGIEGSLRHSDGGYFVVLVAK